MSYIFPPNVAVPNPPTDVAIETLGPEELRVTWGFPSEWDDQIFAYFLEYKLEVTTDHGALTRMVSYFSSFLSDFSSLLISIKS